MLNEPESGLADQIRQAFAGPRPADACAEAMAAPRKLLLRFPGPPAASAARAHIEGQTVLDAIHTLLAFLDVDPQAAFGRMVQADGDRLALMVVPAGQPDRLARVAAFILGGVSELELNLALAWWADQGAKGGRA